MAEERIIGVKLTVKTKNGNFANSNISLTAENDKIFRLAQAINGLQNDPSTEIIKSVTAELQE